MKILQDLIISHSFSASINLAFSFLFLDSQLLSPAPPAFPLLPTYRLNTSANYKPELTCRATTFFSAKYHIMVNKINFKIKTLIMMQCKQ